MLNKFLTALLLIGGTSALHAGPVYSCGGGSACDGNLYAVWVSGQTATTYVLNVSIEVTNNYLTANGGPGSHNDFISALAITPDNNSSFTHATLTGAPGGVWSLGTGGLDASGCSGSGATYICAGATGAGAALFSLSRHYLYAEDTELSVPDHWAAAVFGRYSPHQISLYLQQCQSRRLGIVRCRHTVHQR